MSNCSLCGKGFGFFSREVGCPRCNRVFCKKCLCHKVVDKVTSKTINVCLRCSKIDDTMLPTDKNKKQQLEDILKVESNEINDPVLEPQNEIQAKLDDLKNTYDESQLSVEESNIDDIQKRLANLKGIEFNKPINKVLFTPDTRSEQEKIDELLKQFVEEKEINDQHKVKTEDQSGSIDDIERRLAALRNMDVSKLKSDLDKEYVEETEQEEISRTVLQYLEEAKLPDFVADPDEQELISSIPPPPGGNKKDLEELPFCEICNEDAVIRCLDCENIFCHRCFFEFHDEEDYRTHKTKPYQAPKENKI